MLVINTNIASLQAQQALNSSQGSLQTSLQRLSTGLRINNAADDAAGLAISDGMTAQINGLNQAARNANDAISLAQTAEGNLQSIGNMLQRMRQLAVEAANGTNSTSDRANLQNEVDQIYSAIDQVAQNAQFNNVPLFTGPTAASPFSFQIGPNAGDFISFTTGEVNTQTLGLNSNVPLGTMVSSRMELASMFGSASGPKAGDLVINGIQIAGMSAAVSLYAAGQYSLNKLFMSTLVTAINTASGQTNVTATAYNNLQGSPATVDASHPITGLSIAVGTTAPVTIITSSSLTQLVDNINQQVAGLTATIGSNGNLVLSNNTGQPITIGGTPANSGLVTGTYNGYLAFSSSNGQPINFGTSTNTPAANLHKLGLNQASGSTIVVAAGVIYTGSAGGTYSTMSAGSQYNPANNANDVVRINGVMVGTSATRQAADMAAAINAVQTQTGVTATASTTLGLTLSLSLMAPATNAIAFTVNGVAVQFSTQPSDLAAVVAKINSTGIAGVVATADTTTGRLVLSSTSGVDIQVKNSSSTPGSVVGAYLSPTQLTPTITTVGTQIIARGTIQLQGKDGKSISVQGNGSPSNGTGLTKFGLAGQNEEATKGTVGSGISIMTAASATAAMTAIDHAIKVIDNLRSKYGAIENRFTDTISNLNTTSTNVSAARSRIRDTDFASETANLTRSQILQQAGTAMLAQANQVPNQVLALLKSG
ncbi:hypothetical protein KSF73_15710 [Burkholderiaceae bacterium DAT-1]|nr:hypothetical protein [Burkholderiaceae bacterium DAT-1]